MEERLWDWWRGLTEEQQVKAKLIVDNVPDWMVSSLADADLSIVEADLNGDGHVRLMPTVVREFVHFRGLENK